MKSTNTHFTADTHFLHANIIKMGDGRPFADLEEMTEALISNWNSVVKKGDVVYHDGDFALTYKKTCGPIVDKILSRLNGQKFLITGNHDRKEVTQSKHWVNVMPYHEIKVDLGGKHKQRIVMSHYAMRVWNQNHRGSWMLHGHSHGNLDDIGGKTLDVGVDPMGYFPISIEELKEMMDRRPMKLGSDHHQAN